MIITAKVLKDPRIGEYLNLDRSVIVGKPYYHISLPQEIHSQSATLEYLCVRYPDYVAQINNCILIDVTINIPD